MHYQLAFLYCRAVGQILIIAILKQSLITRIKERYLHMEQNHRNTIAWYSMFNSASTAALSRFRQPLVEYLISALDDDDKWVRYMAAELLGDVGDPVAADHLRRLLTDQDADLRIVSACALQAINQPAHPEGGGQYCDCGSCLIRVIAEEAMSKLNEQKYHPSRR
jgi:HEAT repeat protein